MPDEGQSATPPAEQATPPGPIIGTAALALSIGLGVLLTAAGALGLVYVLVGWVTAPLALMGGDWSDAVGLLAVLVIETLVALGVAAVGIGLTRRDDRAIVPAIGIGALLLVPGSMALASAPFDPMAMLPVTFALLLVMLAPPYPRYWFTMRGHREASARALVPYGVAVAGATALWGALAVAAGWSRAGGSVRADVITGASTLSRVLAPAVLVAIVFAPAPLLRLARSRTRAATMAVGIAIAIGFGALFATVVVPGF